MGKLDGRVALITGGAVGMGAAHARILSEEGAKVAICDIDAAQGEALAKSIGGVFHRLDVSKEDEWSAALDRIAAQLGPVSILVNNAGIGSMNAVQDTTTEEWNRVMAINVTGTFFGIRAVTPQMIAAGGGVIVNVSSAAGLSGFAGMAAYTASKWAVRGLTKVAALDLAKHKIRVLSLHPGLTRTPMASGVDLLQATAGNPIPRPAEPEEMARMVLFMVAEASFTTGSEFIADGGVCAGQLNEFVTG